MQLRVFLNRAGTYFYHAHHLLYDTTCFGALIVHDIDDFIEERNIILSDHFHKDTRDLVAGLNAVPFKWIGDADSILTNGLSRFDPCVAKNSTFACSPSEPKFAIISVDYGKQYRLRIINAGTLGNFVFAIAGHTLTIVEVDSHPVVPYAVDQLEINSGQRYSVLISTFSQPADYWINTRVVYRASGPANGQAVLRYSTQSTQPIPTTFVNTSLPQITTPTPGWIQTQLAQKYPDVSNATVDQIFKFYGRQTNNSGLVRWEMNNISYKAPEMPVLQLAYQNKLSQLPVEARPFTVKLNSVVDIVLINTASLNGICEEHPWHLHGHSFHVLAQGEGDFNPSNLTLNTLNPVKRDTVTLYPFAGASFQPKIQPGTPCGWTYLRVKFDNAGVWPLHCHISSHMMLGMMVSFQVGEFKDLPVLPSDIPDFAPQPTTSWASTAGVGFLSIVFLFTYLL